MTRDWTKATDGQLSREWCECVDRISEFTRMPWPEMLDHYERCLKEINKEKKRRLAPSKCICGWAESVRYADLAKATWEAPNLPMGTLVRE